MSARVVPKACPSCGSADVKPIVYGYPSFEMFDDPTIALGGCVIFDKSPEFVCDACQHDWGRL